MASKFLNLSTDTTLGGNAPSDEIVSSQKALKTYIDAHGGGSSYTAGTGIDITNDTISVTSPTLVNEASRSNAVVVTVPGGTACTADRGGNSIIIGDNVHGGSLNDSGSIIIGKNINNNNTYNYGNGIYMAPQGISKVGGSIILSTSSSGIGNYSGKAGGIIIASNGTNARIGTSSGTQKGAYSIMFGSFIKPSGDYSASTFELNADYTIVIGSGYTRPKSTSTSITEDNTFWWGNQNGLYKLFESDGTMSTDRFTTTPSADGTYVATLTVSSGTVTRSWASGGGGGSSYTAGTGIDITSNVISVDLTAGDGIGVSGATISLGNIDCGTMS